MTTLLTRTLIALGAALLTSSATAPSGATADVESRAAAQACVETAAPVCFAGVQQALDAAPAGATVRLSPGEFAGGLVITKDVELVGSGAGSTVVRGGGPVILVRSTRQHRPVVGVASLTITGGLTHHADDADPSNAFGGGLFVPPVHGQGATVSLRHVAVTGNATRPSSTSDSPSGVRCPHAFCPYAGSYGGGIATFGDLSLDDVVVSGNVAGGLASDADGGGIYSSGGTLRVADSRIEDNHAVPDQIGRFAEGGGIFATDGGRVVLERTVVADNSAELVTGWPVRARGEVIDMNANSGGVHIGDGIVARLDRVEISRNTARAVDPHGEPLAFDGAMLVGDSVLTMRRSLVSENTVEAEVRTTADVGFSGTALEVDGPATITGTRIVDNVARTTTRRGVAAASSGLAVYDFSDNPRQVLVRHSTISGNLAMATSAHGTAAVTGAGVINNSLLRMVDVRIDHNRARVIGSHASAQGGGIWNGPLLSGPPVRLELRAVRVRHNIVTAAGGSAQGGGIFTTVSILVHGLTLSSNRPSQCYGCR